MEVTDDERAFGFESRTLGGTELVAAQLHGGLYAVKRDESGTVEYVICDSELRTLYSPAKSLDELRARFR